MLCLTPFIDIETGYLLFIKRKAAGETAARSDTQDVHS